jgi:mannitol/fructose-specific phosphotransferase system IIA component (Ntr-type)
VKLSEVLPHAAVHLDVDGLDKWAIIERLTDALVESEQISSANRDEVHEALVIRERSMSTGMEKGIAIPHASVASAERTAVALGISREGVAFEAIDGQPTHLVILLVNPSNQTKAHIRTLAEIARLLSNADLRTALRGADNPEDVLEVIRSAEAAVT